MVMRREIPLPVSGFARFGYRAIRGKDAIRFEPTGPASGLNIRKYGFLFVFVVVLLTGYIAIAIALSRQGDGPDWWFHAMMLGFSLLILAAIGFRSRFHTRFRGSALSRNSDGTLRLQYHWHNGGEKICHLKNPACLLIRLDHDIEGNLSSHDLSERGGTARKEKFQDRVEFDIILEGMAIAPRIPIFTKRSYPLAPSMSLYFREHSCDKNREIAMEAARPVAEAILECVGIPVEFRVFGGPLLQRLEPTFPEHRRHR